MVSAQETQAVCHILKISNEILMMILGYLPTADLFSAAKSCSRLKDLCFERRNFISIENPEDNLETMEILFKRCYCSRRTQKVKIISRTYPNSAFRSSLSTSLLMKLSPSIKPQLIALTHLYLIRQKFDGRLIQSINMFPSTLKVFHLCGTELSHIKDESVWFKNMSKHFKALEDLDLSFCSFISSHCFLAISKVPELTRLSFEGCRTIGNSIAYSCLAFKWGFPKLKILNMNNTSIQGSDFASICALGPKLEELYFGQYDSFSEPDHHLITDPAIEHYLTECTNLKVVDMSGSHTTDASIAHLLQLPNLVRVEAHFTQMTLSYIEYVRGLGHELHINTTTAPGLQF